MTFPNKYIIFGESHFLNINFQFQLSIEVHRLDYKRLAEAKVISAFSLKKSFWDLLDKGTVLFFAHCILKFKSLIPRTMCSHCGDDLYLRTIENINC